MYLLDTDHISILQKQTGLEYIALMARMGQVAQSDISFCIVSFHEQVLGCQAYLARAQSPANVVRGYRMLDRVLTAFSAAQVLAFDDAASATFDSLHGQRIRVATMDLRIASIALSQSRVLVTRNARDFAKVPGLAIVDWTV